MTGRRRDLGLGAGLLAFAAAMWWWLIPVYAGEGDQVILPRLITLVVAFLAAVMLLWNLIPALGAARQDDDPFLELGDGEAPSTIGLALVWGLFAFTLPYVGFYPGGGLAMLASYLLLGLSRPLPLLLWTTTTLLTVHLVFEQAFQLVIRPGMLERWLVGG